MVVGQGGYVTAFGLMRALRRAWFVVVVGVLATMGSMYWITSAGGVYYGQVDVVFLRPVNAHVPNSLSTTSGSVIATAGIVQRQVAGGPEGAHVVSDGVTLAQEGVTSGQSVRLPNAGGQWANNFNRAELDVQVVDTTSEGANARMSEVLARIDASLAQLQATAKVDPSNAIRTGLNPITPTITHEPGNPKRALVMTLLLGALLTIGAVILVDRVLLRHSRRSSRPVAPPRHPRVRVPASSHH
jgi:hypothetical protein